MSMSVNDTIRSAQTTLAGINDLHKHIRSLETRIARAKAQAEHWRTIAGVQSRAITRLKKGMNP